MRPIPIDVLPSHVYLSQDDQSKLFGFGYAMTIEGELTQSGQCYYEETLKVKGNLKRELVIHVLGPNWERSFVELTAVETIYLGLKVSEAVSGDLSNASKCTLIGPNGTVNLEYGVVTPLPHLRCSPIQARELGITNGEHVNMEILGQNSKILNDVIVRVHPTFQLRLEINADYARELWIARTSHARLLD